MPLPGLALGLGTFFKFLQGIIGTGSSAFELDSNNAMNIAIKGNAVAKHVHEAGIKLATAIGIDEPLRLPFAEEMWQAIFTVFQGGQHWELSILTQLNKAISNMIEVLDKYKPKNYTSTAYLQYMIDLGGESQMHWWRGSGKSKIQGRFGPGHWKNKLNDLFSKYQSTGGGGGGGKTENTEEEMRAWINTLINPAFNLYLGRDMDPGTVTHYMNVLKLPCPMPQSLLDSYINNVKISAEAIAYAAKQGGKTPPSEGKAKSGSILPIILIGVAALAFTKTKNPIGLITPP